jgi:hypothetical protein
MVNGMETVVEAKTLQGATKYLHSLQVQSGKFMSGGFPYYGTLKNSYGYNKKIGMISFDHSVWYRIDYDE